MAKAVGGRSAVSCLSESKGDGGNASCWQMLWMEISCITDSPGGGKGDGCGQKQQMDFLTAAVCLNLEVWAVDECTFIKRL